MEKPKSIGDIYDKEKVDRYYETVGKEVEAKLEEDKYLLSILPKNLEGKSVIDIGCGNARYSELFCQLGAEKVVGLDFSQEMIKEAEKRKEESNLKHLELVRADMNELPLAANSFDVVFSRFSLMYGEDLDLLMKRISQSLKDQGEVYILASIISIGNPALEKEIKSLPIFREIEVGDKRVPVENYVQTLDDYKEAFRQAGLTLQDEKIFNTNDRTFPAPDYKYKNEVGFECGVFKLSKIKKD